MIQIFVVIDPIHFSSNVDGIKQWKWVVQELNLTIEGEKNIRIFKISEPFEIYEAVIFLLEISAGELVWTTLESWELILETHCYTS